MSLPCCTTHHLAAGLTNRKFQSGKQAKKIAEKMSIQREFQRQQQALQAQQSRGERGEGAGDAGGEGAQAGGADLLQELNERRGMSLMEEHLAKRAKTTGGAGSNKGERRAFDRERDLLSHGRMNEDRVATLVKGAKELEDRFDKAAVQKSFL